MGPEKYNSWLANASFRSYDNGIFTIGLDSEIRAILNNKTLKATFEGLQGSELKSAPRGIGFASWDHAVGVF